MQKIKSLLKAAVVIAVALAFILPGSAVVTNNNVIEKNSLTGATRTTIKEYQKLKLSESSILRDNIVFTNPGDDILPSICEDPNGIVVITSTNQPSFSEGYQNIWYSSTPTDPYSWNGWLMTLSGYDMYFDTAHIKGPLSTDHNYLMGVYMDITGETAGYYEIDNVAAEDPSTEWLYWTWNNGAPEPEYACIADGGYFDDKNNPEMCGPFNFYIYHEIYQTYDIPGCPTFMHTDLRNDTGGQGYFDGQSFELTAPASEPDYVYLGDRYQTVIQYNDPSGPAKIVWKKTVPTEEPDYEFTPYQATIATGTNPAIAAYDSGSSKNIDIVYVDSGTIKSIYSIDDGVNWDTSVIGDGKYPDIFAFEGKYYCAYINDHNIYLTISENDGQSWSTPEQINVNPDSVAEQANSIDISAGGMVWIDETSGSDLDMVYYDLGLMANNPPNQPTITGPTSGKYGTALDYKFNAVDPDGDTVLYLITWGDGKTDTTTLNPSGTEITVSHTWTDQGDYTITAKAQDSKGLTGPEKTLNVHIPKSRTISLRFFDLLPHAFPILRILLGL